MKTERKPKVITQILGYRVKQMSDGKNLLKRYGIYAGKKLINESKGYETPEEAIGVINRINSGEIKPVVIKK